MSKIKKDINIKLMFELEPEEAVNYLEKKGFKITNDWREMSEAAHAKAFTISKMTDAELLKDTKTTLDTALKEGWSSQKTQRELTNMFKERGWWGKQTITDKNGEEKTIQLGSPHRVRTIYKQNMQSALNSGRYLKQLQNVDFAPYFQYVCVLDERTRPEHKALHGKVFRYDDPIWASLYPPNGWGCRCFVKALTEREIQRKDLTIENSGENLSHKNVVVNETTGETKEVAIFKTKLGGKTINIQTDAGWSSNTGRHSWNIDVMAYKSMSGLPENVRDKFISEMAQNVHCQKAFENFVKNTTLPKGLEQTVTWLSPQMIKRLQTDTFLPETPVVVLQDDRIGHALTNKIIKQRLTEPEFLNLYNIINNPDAVYYDYTRKGSTGIAFIQNIPNSDKCIKVCVKLGQKHKKTKMPVNYISTVGKVDKKSLNNPLYKKIE